jgi:hypothetical protein
MGRFRKEFTGLRGAFFINLFLQLKNNTRQRRDPIWKMFFFTVFYLFLMLLASFLVNKIWTSFYTQRSMINLLILYIPPFIGKRSPDLYIRRASNIVIAIITIFIVLYFAFGLLIGDPTQGTTDKAVNNSMSTVEKYMTG